MNNKGFTMLDVVVSIVIIGLVLAVVIPVLFTVKSTIKSNQNESLYIQTMYNTIAKVKGIEDWGSIENETIQIYNERLDITYNYEGETEFDTEKIELSFKINNIIKKHNLERSIYHDF